VPAKEDSKVNRVIILTHADKDAKPGEKQEFRIRGKDGGRFETSSSPTATARRPRSMKVPAARKPGSSTAGSRG
jgi:hypothetical protein